MARAAAAQVCIATRNVTIDLSNMLCIEADITTNARYTGLALWL
jgi:hypothetical protein